MYRIYLDCKLMFFLRKILFPFSWKITIGFTQGHHQQTRWLGQCNAFSLALMMLLSPVLSCLMCLSTFLRQNGRGVWSTFAMCWSLNCSLFSVLCGSDLSDSSMNTLDCHLLLFRLPLTGVCSLSKTDSASMFKAFEPGIWQTRRLFWGLVSSKICFAQIRNQ